MGNLRKVELLQEPPKKRSNSKTTSSGASKAPEIVQVKKIQPSQRNNERGSTQKPASSPVYSSDGAFFPKKNPYEGTTTRRPNPFENVPYSDPLTRAYSEKTGWRDPKAQALYDLAERMQNPQRNTQIPTFRSGPLADAARGPRSRSVEAEYTTPRYKSDPEAGKYIEQSIRSAQNPFVRNISSHIDPTDGSIIFNGPTGGKDNWMNGYNIQQNLGSDEFRNSQREINARMAAGQDYGRTDYEMSVFNNMTADEQKEYSYRLGKYGRGEADRYLQIVGEKVSNRRAKEIVDEVNRDIILEANGVPTSYVDPDTGETVTLGGSPINTAGRVLKRGKLAAQSGLDMFRTGVGDRFTNYVTGRDKITPASPEARASQQVKEDLTGAGRVAYDVVENAAMMLPTTAAALAASVAMPQFAPQILAAGTQNSVAAAAAAKIAADAPQIFSVGATMFPMSAGQAYEEALQKGLSPNQARLFATAEGLNQAAGEYLLGGFEDISGGYAKQAVDRALGNVVSDTTKSATQQTVARAVQHFLTTPEGRMAFSMGSEAFEEIVQGSVSNALGNVAFGEENAPISQEDLYSGLIASLSAGLSNARYYATGYANGAGRVYSAEDIRAAANNIVTDRAAYQNQAAYDAAMEQREQMLAQADYVEQGGKLTPLEKSELADAAGGELGEMDRIGRQVKTNRDMQDISDAINTAREIAQTDETKARVDEVSVRAADIAKRRAEGKQVTDAEVGRLVNDTIRATMAAGNERATAAMEARSRIGFGEQGASVIESSKASGQKLEAMTAAYEEARYNIQRNDAQKQLASGLLSEQEFSAIYQAGIQDRNAFYNNDYSEKIAKIAEKYRPGNIKRGTVTYDGVDIQALENAGDKESRTRYAQMKTIEHFLSGTLGYNVEWFESKTEDGRYTGENGSYTPSKHLIRLDVNAGADVIGDKVKFASVISHELTHTIEDGSPVQYQKLADSVMKMLVADQEYSQGRTAEQIVADMIENNPYVSNEADAIHELVAQACEDMMSGNRDVRAMFEGMSEAEQKTIFDHISQIFAAIKNFFDEMLNSESVRSNRTEAAAIRRAKENIDALQKEWTEGVKQAAAYNAAAYEEAQRQTAEQTEQNEQMENAFGDDTGRITRDDDGDVVIAESKDREKLVYSLKTLPTTQEKLASVLKRKGYSEESIKAAQNQVQSVADMLTRVSTYYAEMAEALDAELLVDPKTGKTVLHSFVTNGDYPVNIDFLTICKKREAYMHVLTDLIEHGIFDKVAFNGAAIATTNEILRDSGFETACACCFVESRRLQIQRWAETFCSEWNEEVLKRNPNATPFNFSKGERGANDLTQDELIELENELRSVTRKEKNPKGNIKLPNKGARANMGPLLDRIPALAHTLSVGDLITPNGIDSLRATDGNLFSLVKQRYGTATPKITQSFSPYNGDVADLNYGFMRTEIHESIPGSKKYKADARKELAGEGIKKPTAQQVEDRALRKYLYDIGGVRLQSFSDFLVENTLDYFQMFADLAAKELPLHAYSKEISFIKMFGMTGGKMNMSLIPVVDLATDKEHAGLKKNKDGTYSYAGWGDYEHHLMIDNRSFIQSIGFKDAIALQLHPGYSSHIGTIAIGISNAHIRKMLNDPLIRMVIPYHSSGMLPEFAKQMHIDYYHDYTTTQNTTLGRCTDMSGNEVETYNLKGNDSYKCDTHYDFNEAFQRLGDARAACEEYKAWCAERHPVYNGSTQVGWAEFTPKFAEFADETNYYKLIEDFNSYDCITEESAVQGAVTMSFPGMEQNLLNDEELKAYEERLRATGQFTEKEIQKYVSRANETLEEIVTREAKNRNAYHREMDKKYDSTLNKIEAELQRDYNKDDYDLVNNKYVRRDGEQRSARYDALDEKQKKNYQYNEKQDIVGGTLKTLKGSTIKRSKYGVGKEIGGQFYFNKEYASDIIPDAELNQAISILAEEYPDFQYNCMMYQPSKNVVRFDEAADFDTAREPMTGDYVSVNLESGEAKTGHSNYIWHHKWLWVKNDYKGFDVEEAWNWSKTWLNTLTEVADGNGIGRWNAQLDRFGLPHDGDTQYSGRLTRGQKYTGEDTSVLQIPGTFTHFEFPAGTRILDYGGGQFNFAKDAVERTYPGVTVEVMDAFNRTSKHNNRISDEFDKNKADAVTVNNVLNVIDSRDARIGVIEQAKRYLKDDGVAYFLMYQADKKAESGEAKGSQKDESRRNYQTNMDQRAYIPEIREVFDYVTEVRSGGDIYLLASNIPLTKDMYRLSDQNSEQVKYLRSIKGDKEEKAKYNTLSQRYGEATVEILDSEYENAANTVLKNGEVGDTATIKKIVDHLAVRENLDKKTVRDLYKIKRDANGNVIPLSQRVEIHDENIRYSARDSSGKTLTAQQAEYFKDSKVRDEDGNLLVVYHGTSEDFNVFDSSKGRANMDIQGSFFSPWDIDAEGYGPNVKTVYLNIKNPAPEGIAYKALNMFKGQNNAGVKAREYLIRRGYDGVNNGNEEYIAFYPEQIKNIDNENPTNSADIRYSTRDSQGKELTEAQQRYFADSKVRNDDGSLKVMYHGTERGGFTVFDPAESDDGISLFFTDYSENAREYSGSYDEITPDRRMSESELFDMIENITEGDFQLSRTADGYAIEEYTLDDEGDFTYKPKKSFKTLKEAQAYAYEEFVKEGRKGGYGTIPGNYAVYLNLQNPLVVDAQDSSWREIPYWENDDGELEPATTREIAEDAKEQGYDGVIINNVWDNGQYAERQGVEANIAIAFSSNQVKSVYNENPTENNDIRYSSRMQELDTEYQEALDARNEDWQLMLVDQAAYNAGYTVGAYHGSPFENIRTFNTRSQDTKKQAKQLLFGTHFTHNLEYAKIYARKAKNSKGTSRMTTKTGQIYKTYLDLGKSLDLRTTRNITPGTEEYKLYEDAPAKYQKKFKPHTFSKYDTEQGLGSGQYITASTIENVLQAMSPKEATDFLVDHGYNSILYDASYATPTSGNNRFTKDPSIIMLDPERIKSGDPVTYDDNGNVIPLSERFNPANEDIRYSNRDTTGKQLTDAQAEYFKDSKARDAEGRLLTLYHGTGFAGFTEFKTERGVWLTTSKRDADSYGGNWEGKIFNPNEKPEIRKTSGETYPVGEHMRFETKEDRDNFLKEYPDAESYLTERELRAKEAELDDDWEADDYDERSEELQELRKRSEKIERAYARYELKHSGSTTIGEMLEDPSLYSLNDFKRVWLSIDREVSFDDEFEYYDSDEEYRDAIAERLRNYIEEGADDQEWHDEMLNDFAVKARIPVGRKGEIFNNVNNRTYELYANVVNPYVFDNHGRGSEFNGSFYHTIEEAMADPQYDGVIVENARVGRYQDLGTVVLVKNPNQVKLTSNKNPSASNDIRFSSRNTTPAPVFYSKLQREVENFKGNKIGAASVESYLKGKGVKDEEIKWSGIRTYLEGKKSVDKAELLQYLRDNEMQIDMRMLTENDTDYFEDGYYSADADEHFETLDQAREYAEQLAAQRYVNTDDVRMEDDYGEYTFAYTDETGEEVTLLTVEEVDPYDREKPGADSTRWREYKLDGGENYREVIFSIPGSGYTNQAMSTHWGPENPGILAHARIQDFETEDGDRVLFVEEIQSDWHNAGQKKGYSPDLIDSKGADILNEIRTSNEFDAIAKQIAQNKFGDTSVKSVSQAKERISELFRQYAEADSSALESKIAEEAGVKRLSRDQSDIVMEYNSYLMDAIGTDYAVPDAPFRTTYTDYVLKNLLRMAAEGNYDYLAWTTGKMQEERWSDEYAEGYRIEYDQQIPKFLKKYGKQWGAGLGEVWMYDAEHDQNYAVPAITVNELMKQSVLTEGQPRFSARDNGFGRNASFGTVEELERRNENIREMNYELDAVLQNRGTQTRKLSDQQIERIARRFLREYSSKADVETITNGLKSMYEYIDNTAKISAQQVGKIANSFAEQILDESKEVDDNMAQMYPELAADIKRTKLYVSPETMKEMAYYFENAADFRRQAKKFVTISEQRDGARGIDTFYEELSGNFPELFDSEIVNEKDQLLQIMDVAEQLKKKTVNKDWGSEYDEIAYTLGQDMVAAYFAEKGDGSHKRNIDMIKAQMKAEHREYVDGLRRAKERQIRELKDKLTGERRQNIAKIAELRAKLNAQFRERQDKAELRRLTTQAKARLQKNARDLWSKRGTPEFEKLKAKLFSELDLISVGISRAGVLNLEKTYNDAVRQAALDPDYAASDEYKNIELKYHGSKDNPSIERKKLRDLSYEEIVSLTEDILALKHSQQTYNRLMKDNFKATVAEYGRKGVAQQNIVTGILNQNGFRANALATAKKYAFYMLNPVRAAHLLDGYQKDGVLTELFDDINNGTTKKTRFQQKTHEMFEKVLNDKELMEGWSDQNIEIEVRGQKYHISKGMRIAIALHAQNTDNIRHIENGGFNIPNERYYKQGRYTDAYNSGTRVWMSKEDMDRIAAGMTEGEKRFAQIANNFFNKTAKDAINETSLVLKGYELAVVPNYFPIRTDKNFTQAEIDGLVHDGTIEGQGQFKDRQPGAKNPILLEDVALVIDRQTQTTGAYYGIAIPVRDMNKVWNYTATAYAASMKDSIGRNWGELGKQTIEKMLTDIQAGARRGDTGDHIFSFLKGAYAASTLVANAGVSIKQAASYPLAISMLDADCLAKGLKMKTDRAYIDSITPWSWDRRHGMGGEEMSDILKQKGMIARNQTAQSVKNFFNWIQKVDVLTTDHLLSACEAQVQKDHPKLEVRGEEYNRKVAELYNEVLWRTQPSYGVMQRNELMRSASFGMKALTMFKTQTFNMGGEILDAALRAQAMNEMSKNGLVSKAEAKRASKALGRVMWATVLSQATLAAMTALANAVLHKMRPYRDDKGEVTGASVARKIGTDFVTSWFGLFFGADIAEQAVASVLNFAQWYDITAPQFDRVNDTVSDLSAWSKALVDWFSEEDESKRSEKGSKLFRASAKVAMSMTMVTGLPAQNIYNMLNAVNLHAQDLFSIEDGRVRWDPTDVAFEAGKGLLGLTDTSITNKQYANQALKYYKQDNLERGDRAAEKTKSSAMQTAIGGKSDYENGKAVKDSRKYNNISRILRYDASNEAKGKIFAAAYPSDDLDAFVEKGGSPYDYMVGQLQKKSTDKLSKDDKKKIFTAVAEDKSTSLEEKKAWLISEKGDTDEYKAWKSANGADWDFIKHSANMEAYVGLPSKEKKEKIVGYIKRQTTDRAKQRALYMMAGYDPDSKKDGKTIKDANFNKAFGYK